MKLLILVSCVLSVQCETRVKRIVGGVKAAIPPAFDINSNIPDDTGPYDGSSEKLPEINKFTSDGADNVVVFNNLFHSARITGVKEKEGYVSFKGIRFAEPPVERNRFVRPVFLPLDGEVSASKYGSPCVQPYGSGKVGEEDCLFLNVFTPTVKATGLPVLFWIHGGGFKYGSGNQYGVKSLVAKSIVVVTINYRLGALGFLGSNNKFISGNAGLFDIRAAFEWTRRYISAFGGDPTKIFPAGQGSGASVATLLAQSSFTSEQIKGVIAMSGTSISSNAIDYKPSDTLNFISESSLCLNSNPLETVRCLQNSDIDKILEIENSLTNNRIGEGFISALTSLLSTGPVVEGENDGRFLSFFLNDNPLNALKGTKYPNIPILIGVTKQETGKLISGPLFSKDVLKNSNNPDFLTKFLPTSLLTSNTGLYSNGTVNELLKSLFDNGDYLKLISSTVSGIASFLVKVIEETTDAIFNLPAVTQSAFWEKTGGPVYFYSFEQASSVSSSFSFLDQIPLYSSQPSEKVVAHGDDLLFLFELQSLEGKPIPNSGLTDPKDLRVKELFINVVAEFLRSGKPNIPGTKQEWPKFGSDNNYVVISSQPKLEKKFRYCQLALWGGFVDKLVDPGCNFPQIGSILKTIPNLEQLVQKNLLTPIANDNVLKTLSNLPEVLQNSDGNGLANVGDLASGIGIFGSKPNGGKKQPVTHLRLTLASG